MTNETKPTRRYRPPLQTTVDASSLYELEKHRDDTGEPIGRYLDRLIAADKRRTTKETTND